MLLSKAQVQNNFPWVLLTLAPFLFFFGPLMGTEVFYFRDVFTEEMANQVWLHDHFGSLWNPGLFTGQPHLANPQAYGFDPLHLFSLLFPGALGFNIFVVSHFWVASIGFFYLMRAWRFDRGASVMSALVFTYGGCFISLGYLPIVLNSMTYLPWILVMLAKTIEAKGPQETLFFFFLLAIALAFQIFGGEPQVVILGLIIAAVATASQHPKSLPRAAVLLTGALALAILLTAIQWIPFLEFLQFSNRKDTLSYAAITRWSLEPTTLLSLLFPHHIANPQKTAAFGLGYWETRMPYFLSLHFGLVTLGAVVFAQKEIRQQPYRAWLILFFIGIFLALGKYNVFFPFLLNIIPGLNAFRFPEKFFLLSHVSFCVLAAVGFQKVLHTQRPKSLRIFWAVGAFLCVWTVIGPLIIPRIFANHSALSFWQRHFFAQVTQSLFFLMLFCIARHFTPSRRQFFLATFVLLELFWVHRFVNPTLPMLDFLESPHAAFWLRNFDGQSRFVSMHSENEKDLMLSRTDSLPNFYLDARRRLSPPTGIEFGLKDINSAYSLHLGAKDFFMQLYKTNQLKTLQILGVKTIVSSYPIVHSDLKKMFQTAAEKPVSIYRLREFLPPAYVVNQWQKTSGFQEDIQEQLLHPAFDPSQSAWVHATGDLPPSQHNGRPFFYSLRNEIFENDTNRLDLSVSQRALLVLQQTHYPGWQVFVDGKEQALHKINGIFQGVFLEAGTHRVVFQYCPKSFYSGFKISLVTWILAIFGLGVIACQKDYLAFFRS